MENLGSELVLFDSFLHMQEDHVQELVSFLSFESQNESSADIFESDFETENTEQPVVIYEASLTIFVHQEEMTLHIHEDYFSILFESSIKLDFELFIENGF